ANTEVSEPENASTTSRIAAAGSARSDSVVNVDASPTSTVSPSRRPARALLNSAPNTATPIEPPRSEEHTSELQSRENLGCRLLPGALHATPCPYTTLFRSREHRGERAGERVDHLAHRRGGQRAQRLRRERGRLAHLDGEPVEAPGQGVVEQRAEHRDADRAA